MKRALPELSAFTFEAFRAWTPELTGPERLELFHKLPEAMQREAWEHLAVAQRAQR